MYIAVDSNDPEIKLLFMVQWLNYIFYSSQGYFVAISLEVMSKF